MSSVATCAGEGLAIRTEGLTRRYGDVLALDRLDLRVPNGAIFGFLGRNGAGKTTTMRLLTGLARPTAGSAWLAGREVTAGDSPARACFGYLPQEAAYYPWMTPREYLRYIGGLYGLDAARLNRRVEELLERMQLADVARRRIGGFSGGMKQRLGIAQALINEPPVLLLDEPTSGLDPAGRYELLDLLAQLRGKVTVFLSSHIIADVERICDLIGVIHKGRLLLTMEREELLAQYPTSAVELELDPASAPLAEGLSLELGAQQWVNTVTREGLTLRALVNDVDAGKQALLALVLSRGALLQRYEWLRPTLEEVFMEVSA